MTEHPSFGYTKIGQAVQLYEDRPNPPRKFWGWLIAALIIGVSIVILSGVLFMKPAEPVALSPAECVELENESWLVFGELADGLGENADQSAQEDRLTELQQQMHDGSCQAPNGDLVPAP